MECQQIVQIIVKKEASPASKCLIGKRIQIFQPGKLQQKNDNYGSHFWSSCGPDAKGRRPVVEVDVQFMRESWPQQKPNGQHEVCFSKKDSLHSEAKTDITGNHLGQTSQALRAEEYDGFEISETVRYMQVNRIAEPNIENYGNARKFMPSTIRLHNRIKHTNPGDSKTQRPMKTTQMDLETGNTKLMPDDSLRVQDQMSTRFGIKFLNVKMVVLLGLQDWALNSFHFKTPLSEKDAAS